MVKKYLCAGIVLGTIVLSACNEEKAEEKVHAEVTKTLADGQTVVVEPISELDEKTTNWLIKKQNELRVSIAEQSKLESKSVKVMCAAIPQEENTDVSCSVVLSTDSKIDDTTIQQIVDNIINSVSKLESAELKIREENIVITNGNGEFLF